MEDENMDRENAEEEEEEAEVEGVDKEARVNLPEPYLNWGRWGRFYVT